MSFDLYLQAFENGDAAGISLDAIRAAFGSQVIEVDDDFWQLQYGGDESSDVFLQPLPGHDLLIHTISIHRPCKNARLWESLWSLLGTPGTIFYFPGCAAPMTRDPFAGCAMPADMRVSLGEPVVAGAALDIFQAVPVI